MEQISHAIQGYSHILFPFVFVYLCKNKNNKVYLTIETALDITVTSPLTPATLRDASSTAGAAAYAAECRKHTANDAKCQELGWACIPLAVETFGNWGMEAQGVFSRLASALGMHQGTSKSWALHTIYSRLNMSLVRSVARSILGRSYVV